MNKFVIGITCGCLLATSLCSGAFAESRREKKGEKLEQQSQQLENKAEKQESEGHALRAGRDARKAAVKGARGERKLKGTGAEPVQPAGAPQ